MARIQIYTHRDVGRIVRLVCDELGVSECDIYRVSRGKANMAFARQVCMYLVSVALEFTEAETGAMFGRDSTVVRYAKQIIEDARDNRGVDVWLDALEAYFKACRYRRGAM